MQKITKLLLPCGLLFARSASAHSFGKLYNLPVPFWMYLYGAAAALLLSFLVVGYFINDQSAAKNQKVKSIQRSEVIQLLTSESGQSAFRVISVFLLFLTVLSGFIGTKNPYLNFNMTWFWIIFVLGFQYLTAIVGNIYATLNPWNVAVDWIELIKPRLFIGRIAYPNSFGVYPALAFYIIFIWIELFAHSTPFSLSVILASYTAINFFGAWLFGKRKWFHECELFSVFLRLIGLIAPIVQIPATNQHPTQVVLRQPFIGLANEEVRSFSLLLFVLFMLSSTAYDGLRDTLPWVKLFWKDAYQNIFKFWVGSDIVKNYPLLQLLYKIWQTAALILSPIIYLLLYLGSLSLTKLLTKTDLSIKELALRFSLTLVPIGFVYNITHYYTLIFTQGSQIFRLFSDPFGKSWNLFGTAKLLGAPIIPSANFVWNSQVILILMGHIVSVYLAHLVAIRIFPSQRQAAISQIPMLLLMMTYTTIGLWILSQPITAGQIMIPTPAN